MDMTADDRRRWNERYRQRGLSFDPAGLLVEHADLLKGGRGLDLACGTGANAFFLAEHGYRVDAIDLSDVGLQIAQAEGRRRGVSVNWIQAAAASLPLPGPAYDCIVVFRFLDRAVMDELPRLLKPGGLLFYESYNIRRLKSHPDFNPAYLLEIGELPAWFKDLEIIMARDRRDVSSFIGRR
ncbi:MAG: class I SAM-dependent methyltransferase [Anaerolineae bacterium]